MNICNELWNDTATTAVKHQDLITLRVVRNISWARWPPCVSYYRCVERTVAASWPWRYSTSSSTCRWVFGSLRSRGLSSCRPRPRHSLPPCCSGSSPSRSETVSWTILRHSRMNLEIDDNKVWIQFYQLDDLFEYIMLNLGSIRMYILMLDTFRMKQTQMYVCTLVEFILVEIWIHCCTKLNWICIGRMLVYIHSQQRIEKCENCS